ncbi:MAG TPA: ATP-binding protein [Acidimicrobiales bacterium]|jgi:two-component system sensor histidine kinase KdpD
MARLSITERSLWVGTGLGLTLVGLTLVVLVPLRSDTSRTSPALVLVVAVVAAGLVSGARAAVLTAVAAAAAFNLAFIPPIWTFKVDAAEDWVALAVFVAVAMVIGVLTAAERDRRMAAEQREAEIRALYEQLKVIADERGRLAEEVARVDVLERVDEQRAALLRSVSHDLRTPLATIRAVAGDLRDGMLYDEATRAELLASVCDEAERLDRIVANLLSLSRIEAGALTPDRQAVPFDELVGDRLRRLGGLFGHVRVQVTFRDRPLIDGDYSQLDQLLTNLLENAARHAPQGTTVRITARCRGDMLEVRVSDEGIGVPEWERTRLFEPFRRGEGSASSGVGLAICKAIVEAHGGAMWVERTPGGGATFAFTLPVRQMPT